MNLFESLVKYDKMVIKENLRLKKIYNQIISEACCDEECNETDIMDKYDIPAVDETDMPQMRGRGGIQKELPREYNPDFDDEDYIEDQGREAFDQEMAEINKNDENDDVDEDDEMANPVVGEGDKSAAAWFGSPVKEDDLLMNRNHNRHGSLKEDEIEDDSAAEDKKTKKTADKKSDKELDEAEFNDVGMFDPMAAAVDGLAEKEEFDEDDLLMGRNHNRHGSLNEKDQDAAKKSDKELDEAEFNDVGMFDPMAAAVDGLAEKEEFDEGQNIKLQPLEDFYDKNTSKKEDSMSEEDFFEPVLKK